MCSCLGLCVAARTYARDAVGAVHPPPPTPRPPAPPPQGWVALGWVGVGVGLGLGWIGFGLGLGWVGLGWGWVGWQENVEHVSIRILIEGVFLPPFGFETQLKIFN